VALSTLIKQPKIGHFYISAKRQRSLIESNKKHEQNILALLEEGNEEQATQVA
jgi:hypothetical protein